MTTAPHDTVADLCPLVECTASTVDQRDCAVCPHNRPTAPEALGLWCSRIVEIEPTHLLQAVPAHRPEEGAVGDCFRTAIACLLGLDDPTVLPHFVEQSIGTGGGAWEDIRLARVCLREHHDADLLAVNLEAAVEWNCAYLLSVHSKSGPWPHCVLGRGREVIHDPSGRGGYTVADLYDEPIVFVLCEPYEPDPDEMVRLWTTQDPGDGALVPEDATPPAASSGTCSTNTTTNEENVA